MTHKMVLDNFQISQYSYSTKLWSYLDIEVNYYVSIAIWKSNVQLKEESRMNLLKKEFRHASKPPLFLQFNQNHSWHLVYCMYQSPLFLISSIFYNDSSKIHSISFFFSFFLSIIIPFIDFNIPTTTTTLYTFCWLYLYQHLCLASFVVPIYNCIYFKPWPTLSSPTIQCLFFLNL